RTPSTAEERFEIALDRNPEDAVRQPERMRLHRNRIRSNQLRRGRAAVPRPNTDLLPIRTAGGSGSFTVDVETGIAATRRRKRSETKADHRPIAPPKVHPGPVGDLVAPCVMPCRDSLDVPEHARFADDEERPALRIAGGDDERAVA